MNERVEIARQLIHDVVASFVEFRERITIVTNQTARLDRVIFTLRVDDRDYGKVAGKQGSHIKALKYLVDAIGQADDSCYDLELVGNPMVHGRPQPHAQPCRTYNPESSRRLLERLAQAIVPGTAVTVEPVRLQEIPPVFLFGLTAADQESYNDLLAPYDDDPMGLTTASALGTIWRAAGMRDGVKFRIEIRQYDQAPTPTA